MGRYRRRTPNAVSLARNKSMSFCHGISASHFSAYNIFMGAAWRPRNASNKRSFTHYWVASKKSETGIDVWTLSQCIGLHVNGARIYWDSVNQPHTHT